MENFIFCTVTIMKPFHARWLIELYKILKTDQGKEVIISGWQKRPV